jgi:hypothetical protein
LRKADSYHYQINSFPAPQGPERYPNLSRPGADAGHGLRNQFKPGFFFLYLRPATAEVEYEQHQAHTVNILYDDFVSPAF